jgi:hypothetical protein
MPSLLIPARTALSGGLLFRDYKPRRLQSPEDRYMAMYGHVWTRGLGQQQHGYAGAL